MVVVLAGRSVEAVLRHMYTYVIVHINQINFYCLGIGDLNVPLLWYWMLNFNLEVMTGIYIVNSVTLFLLNPCMLHHSCVTHDNEG